ncbi:MAG: hypothetical protein DMG11_14555 [Acidobacteria bacterium]|nr:MAG: hypothetical protein DMG11_14555 [Acidobacteriota bacterium]
MMRSGYVVVLLGALIIGWSIPADAQNTPFKYQFTPYVWLSGLKGDVGARNQTANVNASFNDLLDHLDFGLMGAFEGRLGQWRILTDTLYLDVSGEKGTPRPPFIDASVATKAFIFDQEAGYQILKREGTDLDVTGGIRFWHLKNGLQLARGAESLGIEHTRGWVDPVVGLRFSSDLPKRLFVTAKADIGGFDAAAHIDWQAYGGIGLKFNDRLVGSIGYRNLSVDYMKDGFTFDAGMRGLVLDLGLRF